jgi:UDP-glucose 6-dehydrogenase
VVEESQPLQIALDLAKSGYRVTAFDPLANSNADTVAAGTIRIAENIDVCLAGADAVVYARSDDAYAERVLASHSEGRHPVIIDCWRVLKDHAMNIEDGKYFGVGIASNLINSRRR